MLDGSWNKLGSPRCMNYSTGKVCEKCFTACGTTWVSPDVTITRQVKVCQTCSMAVGVNWVPPDVTITRQVRYIRHVRRQLEQTGFP